MSLANLEWYGWITLFLALSSSSRLGIQAYALDKLKDNETLEVWIPALFVTLTLWMMTP